MIQEITSLQDERIAMFSSMTEAQLRNRLNAEQGIFRRAMNPQPCSVNKNILMVMLQLSSRLVPVCLFIQARANYWHN